jgi:hypothetical protein
VNFQELVHDTFQGSQHLTLNLCSMCCNIKKLNRGEKRHQQLPRPSQHYWMCLKGDGGVVEVDDAVENISCFSMTMGFNVGIFNCGFLMNLVVCSHKEFSELK